MSLPVFFGLLGGLVVLAFLANRQFPRTRIPDVIVLLLVGLLIGPVTGWVDATRYQDITHAFGTLAIILILFEGGLDLKLRETVRHFPGGLLLAILGFAASAGAVAATMRWSLQLDWTDALLIGSVLGCTSSSILLPVLQQMNVRDEVKVPLLVESSLGDVLGVLAVKLLLDYSAQGGPILQSFFGGVLWELVASLLLAGLLGMVWQWILPALSEARFWNILTFAAVLLLYAATETIGASGLVAVLGFGLALSNLTDLRSEQLELVAGGGPDVPPLHTQVHSFHSELAFLVRTFFFVLLGAAVQFGGLRGNLLAAGGALASIFASRWLTLAVSRKAWRALEPREREILLWLMPRGLITAVLGIQVLETRGPDFHFLPAVAFSVILATNAALILGIYRAGKERAAHIPAGPAPPERDLQV